MIIANRLRQKEAVKRAHLRAVINQRKKGKRNKRGNLF